MFMLSTELKFFLDFLFGKWQGFTIVMRSKWWSVVVLSTVLELCSFTHVNLSILRSTA